jgi:hypothetical protein
MVLRAEHCACPSLLVSCQQPSPVAQAPCRSLRHGHCLIQKVLDRVTRDGLCHVWKILVRTEQLIKVLKNTR